MKKRNKFFLLVLASVMMLATGCRRNTEWVVPEGATGGRTTVSAAARENGLVTTVAYIKNLDDGSIEYAFNEKQATFVVKRTQADFERILVIAREGLAKSMPVKIYTVGSNDLTDLTWPDPVETDTYLKWYRDRIFSPEPARKVNVSVIESAKFNDAVWQNWTIFRRCTNVLPDYSTALKIFNYCAAQGCYLGSALVQPCIPFEYVRDGCFARAHKMRQIIEGKYGYCSEKVFSYGSLSVQANKWGGCCVSWSYHVAPLVRVKSGSFTFCYVIDPGMFDKPVLLGTWLAAQENTSCNSSANVNSYSIQPSSAYTPASSSTYSTDPGYSKTNADLVYYNAAGNTCQ